MSHVRQQIRAAVATAAATIATSATVYTSPVYPFDSLPCIAVFTRNEVAEFDSITRPRTSVRDCEIIIEVRAKSATGADNTIDQIAAELEAVLAADVTLGGITRDLRFASFSLDVSGEADKPTMLGTLVFEARYRVSETSAETAL